MALRNWPRGRHGRRKSARITSLLVGTATAILLLVIVSPLTVLEGGALILWVPASTPALMLAVQRGWTTVAAAIVGGLVVVVGIHVLMSAGLLGPASAPVRLALGGTALLPAAGLALARFRKASIARGTPDRRDPATGLLNRRSGLQELRRLWPESERDGELAVLLVHLDGLAEPRDEDQAKRQDRVIVATAAAIRGGLARREMVARMGRCLFLGVLLDQAPDEAERVGQALIQRITEVVDLPDGASIKVGVAAFEPGMGTPDVLIAACERVVATAIGENGHQVRRADRPFVSRSSQPAPSDQPRNSGPRVLLVDDDPDSLRALARLLISVGADVRTAENAREAIRALTTGARFDVLATDIVMPEIGGFTLVEFARRIRPSIAVLFVSGYSAEEAYWGGTPGGRQVFLQKPVERSDLMAALKQLLPAQEPRLFRSPQDEPPQSPGRVLVIDDDQSVSRSLRAVLEVDGEFEVAIQADLGGGLEALRASLPDLVLLDIHLPDGSGLEALPGILV